MPGANTASLVGTWVAAIAAAIALFGIAGPILIWRASRTERQQALATIGSHDHGFLSHGLHLWPSIRLLQRVRAPLLADPPSFDDEASSRDITAFQSLEATTSWVNFGALLMACQVEFARGDVLKVYQTKTQLPVNRL